MSVAKHTIVISRKGVPYKLCKILFGSDGSYYITVPYHSANKALLFMQTVNYVASTPTHIDHECWVPFSEAIELASSDDARIKLSHHPDGFVQFSGQGLVSGRNTDGSPKGIGINTWPLEVFNRGPAFGLSFHGIEQFEQEANASAETCTFCYEELVTLPGYTSLMLEGHYFSPLSRRFIRISPNGTRILPILHPTGMVLELQVVLPKDDCPIGGFFGLDLFGGLSAEISATSGYCLSSSTGNRRTNDKGETLGDGLFCLYPRPDELPTRRSLDYFAPPSPG